MTQQQHKMQQMGKFIVLEGGEGVGKTTNLSYVREYLQHAGISVCATREPGGTELGEALREILLHQQQPLQPDAELLLLFAARAQHIQQVIQPALQAGQWVVCDRFTDASYAYQGGGRGIAWQRIADLEQWVQQGLQPDLVLLLDAAATVGLARVQQRGATDRIEQESVAFFARVRQTYQARAAADPERYAIIDAALPLAAVQQQLVTALQRVLE